MTSLLILTLAVLVFLVAEAMIAARVRASLPLRVHVNGTRGKSTVTQYIAAALRAHGKRTLCKVTGETPTLILPDGTRRLVRRRGRARAREQFTTLWRAHRLHCQAVVLECMSISPLLQRFETALIQPQTSVLTNILDDHREELGMTEEERVAAFITALPRRCTIISGERRHAPEVERGAQASGSRIVLPAVNPAAPFPSGAVPENMEIALAACRELGLDREVSLQAILSEAERLGSMQPWYTQDGIVFLNGFSANDVLSTERLLSRWASLRGGWSRLVFVLNTRSDRPLRTVEFVRWCALHPDRPLIFLTGPHAPFARRRLLHLGVPTERIFRWSPSQARKSGSLLLAAGFPRDTLVAGIGNIAGDGYRVLEGVREWSSKPS